MATARGGEGLGVLRVSSVEQLHIYLAVRRLLCAAVRSPVLQGALCARTSRHISCTCACPAPDTYIHTHPTPITSYLRGPCMPSLTKRGDPEITDVTRSLWHARPARRYVCLCLHTCRRPLGLRGTTPREGKRARGQNWGRLLAFLRGARRALSGGQLK